MAPSELRVVLHAPTGGALVRARRNATNLVQESPGTAVHILVNGEAVAAALDEPDIEMDRLTLVCPNSLKRIGRAAAQPLTVLQEPGVLALARMQSDGWRYIRA
jgi:uncharacterized protein